MFTFKYYKQHNFNCILINLDRTLTELT